MSCGEFSRLFLLLENRYSGKELIDILEKGKSTMSCDEKVSLGATIIVEGVLLARNPVCKIPEEHLSRANDLEEYCSYPWGKLSYDALVESVTKLTPVSLSKDQYGLSGFPLAIQLWALPSVHQLGTHFGTRASSSRDFPLCLQWKRTQTPTLTEVADIAKLDNVEVKCIIGDPKLHNNLVEKVVDVEFGKVIGLVEKGYRIKTSDWVNGYVDLLVASKEIENPFCPPESNESSEKLDKLIQLATLLQKKVEILEKVLGIKENGEQGKHTQDKEGEEEKEDEDIEEAGNEGDKSNTVLPLSQVIQKLGDRVKKAELLTYKRRKQAPEDDNESATGCCQTQNEEDDNITIAEIIKSGEKCGNVENTEEGDAYGRLEVDHNVSDLSQELAHGDETVAVPEVEQRSEENDENNSTDPSNGVSEKEEDDVIDYERLKQRKLAIDELALNMEADMLKMKNNLAKLKQRKIRRNHNKTPVST